MLFLSHVSKSYKLKFLQSFVNVIPIIVILRLKFFVTILANVNIGPETFFGFLKKSYLIPLSCCPRWTSFKVMICNLVSLINEEKYFVHQWQICLAGKRTQDLFQFIFSCFTTELQPGLNLGKSRS